MTAILLVLLSVLVIGSGWLLLAVLLALTIGHGIHIADEKEKEAIRR